MLTLGITYCIIEAQTTYWGNHMNNRPIVTIQIERMRHTMSMMLSEQQLDISAEVERALSRECTPEKIQQIVDDSAREAVSKAVADAVKHWWMTSDTGQSLIKAAIVERMESEAKLWKRA